ncbi:hypothetical protein MBLNU230_g8276t1 [Neophaeotheca triangularis]
MFQAPSPKRRKGGKDAPSDDVIARSNDYLHRLASNRRSWMTGAAAVPTPATTRDVSASDNTSHAPNGSPGACAAATAAQNATAAATNGNITSFGDFLQQQNHQVTNLVDHESPGDILRPHQQPVAVGRNAPNKEVVKGKKLPFLPSPAPSEEQTQSPVIGRPRTNPTTPLVTQIGSNAQPMASRSNSANVQDGARSPNVPRQGPVHHSHNTMPSQATARPILPSNNIAPASMVPAQAHAFSQSPAARPSTSGTASGPPPPQELTQMPFYHKDAAMNHLNHFEGLLVQHKLGDWGESDVGRLTLLRQAIEKADWFYIVLNQVYCTHTIAPTTLPSGFARIPDQSWAHLAALLCDNRVLNPDFNQWSASFPDRITNIPHAMRQAYSWYLEKVAHFLQLLPHHWQTIIQESKARTAPPIVQDLVDRMGMISPVLQTTAFRCVARNFWPSGCRQGLEQLEALHERDQRIFACGSRLNQHGRETYYAAFAGIFKKWMENSGMSPGAGSPPTLNIANAQQQQTQLVQANNGFAQRPPHRSNNVYVQQQQQQQQMQASPMTIQAQNHHQQRAMAAHSPLHASPVVAQEQWQPPIHQQYRQRPQPKRVYPLAHEIPRPQPTHPDTNKVALHQAHLRSPLLGPKEPAPGAEKLYRHVDSYVVPPRKVDPGEAVQMINFHFAQKALEKIPQPTKPPVRGERPTTILTEGSRLFRLRCCKITETNTTNSNHWATSDTVWPDNLLFYINSTPLEPRRKLHHGRNLPIALSPHLRLGTNTLTLCLTRSTDESTRPFPYAIAIEAVATTSHKTLTASIPTIPVAISLAQIQNSLNSSSSSSGVDDEVTLTSTTLTLTLTDPYSGCNIFTTPVRGYSCLHRDCFDLETFLLMRRHEFPGWPSVVDDWRCPICRGDARPGKLVCDGWMVGVREVLEAMGRLDARSIVVGKDGDWKVRDEVRGGVRSDSLERELAEAEEKGLGISGLQKGRAGALARQKRVVEVIELD